MAEDVIARVVPTVALPATPSGLSTLAIIRLGPRLILQGHVLRSQCKHHYVVQRSPPCSSSLFIRPSPVPFLCLALLSYSTCLLYINWKISPAFLIFSSDLPPGSCSHRFFSFPRLRHRRESLFHFYLTNCIIFYSHSYFFPLHPPQFIVLLLTDFRIVTMFLFRQEE